MNKTTPFDWISQLSVIIIATIGCCWPVRGEEVVIYDGFWSSESPINTSARLPAGYYYEEEVSWFTADRCARQFLTSTGMPWLATSIVMPVSYYNYLNVRMKIVPDVDGAPGTSVVWSVVNPPQITESIAVQTIPANAALQPGTLYWLVLEPEEMTGDYSTVYWFPMTSPAAGRSAGATIQVLGNPWSPWNIWYSAEAVALRILGRPIHESVLIDMSTAIEVFFETEPGGWYVPQYSDELTGDEWHPAGPMLIGSGGVTSFLYSSRGVTARVFRVLTD